MIKVLNDKQLEKVSDIAADLGLIFFVSAVIPVFIGVNRNFIIMGFGLAITLGSWALSLLILKRKD